MPALSGMRPLQKCATPPAADAGRNPMNVRSITTRRHYCFVGGSDVSTLQVAEHGNDAHLDVSLFREQRYKQSCILQPPFDVGGLSRLERIRPDLACRCRPDCPRHCVAPHQSTPVRLVGSLAGRVCACRRKPVCRRKAMLRETPAYPLFREQSASASPNTNPES